jgi:hypothetical protein
MKNTTDWTNALNDLYTAQDEKTISPVQAVEMNNTAGKVIGFLKLQLEYNKLRLQTKGKIAKIAMLETPPE